MSDVETLLEIELRCAERFYCPDQQMVSVIIKPELGLSLMQVHDLSRLGIALVSSRQVPKGSRLALPWDFGPYRNRRNMLATAVYCNSYLVDEWLVGCAFAEPLTDDELRSFLLWTARTGADV